MDRKAQLPQQQRRKASTSARHDRLSRRQEVRRGDHRTIESSEIECMHAKSVPPTVLKSMRLHTRKVQHSRRIRHAYNPGTISRLGPAISGVGFHTASGDDRFYKSCNFLPGRLGNPSEKPDLKMIACKQNAAVSCRRKMRCSPMIASGHLALFLHPYPFCLQFIIRKTE